MAATGNWSAQQLAEFLSALSAAENEAQATHRAVERAAEALEAEVGVMVRDQRIETAIGFPPDRVPAERILSLVESGATSLELEGLGHCAATSVPIDDDPGGHLVFARSSGADFRPLERNLMRAMGRVLNLSLAKLRALSAEQERRTLLDHMSRIQRSISHHAPTSTVLAAITEGAADLLGDEMAATLLIDEDDPEQLIMTAAVGIAEGLRDDVRRRRADEGVVGAAIEQERLIVVEDYQDADPSITHHRFVQEGLQAVMCAPVREGERVVGCLSVGTARPGRRYSDAEREILPAFAAYVGLALADAGLTDQVRRAQHDPLTGLPNRAYLHDRLRAVERRRDDVAVLVLDLDSFRDINDRLGSAIGDAVLLEVAARLRNAAGHGDDVVRLGSDEFAIVPANADSAGGLAEMVLKTLEEPFTTGGREIHMTASLGLAVGDQSPEDLMRNADLAMSHAAIDGGTRCAVYEPRMHTELIERFELTDDLSRALDRGELEAYFQPKVDLATWQVTGVEALVRWRHPERGLLGPAVFLDLAEASGQMGRLTALVLDQTLDLVGTWWPGGRRLEASLNLSPTVFDEAGSDFAAQVESRLAESKLPGEALQFELTEAAVMRDDDAALQSLARLSELGISLSIDDFGTGYSSLSRLKVLPIDELKIDRSFVMGLTEQSDDLPIVRATIELAHSMGLEVVAEGVETETAWRCLQRLGCERAQGFLIAKPLPGDELEAWIGRWESERRRFAANRNGSSGPGSARRSGDPLAV